MNWKQEFEKRFNSLCYEQQPWRVFSDSVAMMACAISNAVDTKHKGRADKLYETSLKTFKGDVKGPSDLFGITTMALEDNPEQDFLGEMYMALGLGDSKKGQFFTPYHVSGMTSECTEYPMNHWFSVMDPACGAGAMLIGAANSIRKRGINYQLRTIFVGQDIDHMSALMCYTQLSLLGCPGYVAIGDSLSNPVEGNILNPIEAENQELWFTPMFFDAIWSVRRWEEYGRLKKPAGA